MSATKKRPTARTLERLRLNGHTAQVVERWQIIPKHPGGGVRQDLFGCIDVLAIISNQIVGIQCGAASGHAAHKKKCLAEPRLAEWLQTGARFLIHSWSKMGAAKKRKLWTLREEELTLSDYQPLAHPDAP